MPISCDPNDLADSAKCFCYDAVTFQQVRIYLLQQIAGDTHTAAELAALAKCFCFDAKTAKAVEAYLLCLAAGG